MSYGDSVNFTVPAGVRVLAITTAGAFGKVPKYVGVTPGSVHRFTVTRKHYYRPHGGYPYNYYLKCATHGDKVLRSHGRTSSHFTISWSPEINTHTPKATDY